MFQSGIVINVGKSKQIFLLKHQFTRSATLRGL
jgi:hypothetical protein